MRFSRAAVAALTALIGGALGMGATASAVPLPRIRSPHVAVALALLAILGGCLAAGAATSATDAAWTDRGYASATMTSGTWKTPTAPSTCVAYSSADKVIAGCAVKGIDYNGWGEPGKQTRNYYVHFAVPAETHHVTFTIDLSTATGDGKAWSWTQAGVVTGAQFTATSGWTCAALPTVTGRGLDWQVPDIFFQVYEDKSAGAVMCK